MKFIPFHIPNLDTKVIGKIQNVIKSGWLSSGPKVLEFEKKFAELCNNKHAISINSNTNGLHIGLKTLGVKSRTKVITSPYSFVASANSILYNGAKPIFVDIDPETYNIDPNKIEEAVKKNKDCVAIMPVHIAGRICDMKAISYIAKKYNLKIIEDAAHAIPSSYGDFQVGRFSDLSVFSFYATKPMSLGEGGMIITNNRKLKDKLIQYRLHGISKNVYDRYRSNKPSWHYEINDLGFKYNMTDITAAIGIYQLKKININWNKRRNIAKSYLKELKNLPIILPKDDEKNFKHSWHLFIIKVPQNYRDNFIKYMSKNNIGTSVHYIPIHMHRYYKSMFSFDKNDFPNSYQNFMSSVSIPIYENLTPNQQTHIIKKIKEFF